MKKLFAAFLLSSTLIGCKDYRNSDVAKLDALPVNKDLKMTIARQVYAADATIDSVAPSDEYHPKRYKVYGMTKDSLNFNIEVLAKSENTKILGAKKEMRARDTAKYHTHFGDDPKRKYKKIYDAMILDLYENNYRLQYTNYISERKTGIGVTGDVYNPHTGQKPNLVEFLNLPIPAPSKDQKNLIKRRPDVPLKLSDLIMPFTTSYYMEKTLMNGKNEPNINKEILQQIYNSGAKIDTAFESFLLETKSHFFTQTSMVIAGKAKDNSQFVMHFIASNNKFSIANIEEMSRYKSNEYFSEFSWSPDSFTKTHFEIIEHSPDHKLSKGKIEAFIDSNHLMVDLSPEAFLSKPWPKKLKR